MILLIMGIALWVVVHLLPTLGRKLRRKIIVKIGTNPYRGIFSLLIITAIVLMVKGWKMITPQYIYATWEWSLYLTVVLMYGVSILFIAAQLKSNIKRWLRHPQLYGLCLWSVAHLLSNGDTRSLVLFMGMGLWGILMIVTINLRDGEWQKPEVMPIKYDVIAVLGGSALFAVFLFLHGYIAGVSLI